MDYRIISADDHIDMPWLPKDLWQTRVPAAWRDRAPKVIDTADGPYWVCGDDRWDPWGGRTGAAGAMGGRRLALEKGGVLEPGVLRPTTTALRLADMDRDGVDATVMYGPIVPLLVQDPELRRVCYRAYNEWLAEFCATAPARLIGAGLVPIDDPKDAAEEVHHLKALGLRTGMFLAARAETPLWDDLRLLDVIGDDRVMWASDYPHADSTWPDSQDAIATNFKDVPAASRRRILCENARELYAL